MEGEKNNSKGKSVHTTVTLETYLALEAREVAKRYMMMCVTEKALGEVQRLV